MRLRVSTLPQADADIDEIYLFIGNDSPDAASRFLAAVQETIELLAQQPFIGSIRDVRSPLVQGLRSFRVRGFPNHLILYLSDEQTLHVLRVCHGAQDLDAMFE